jgi:hypothetical protein
MKKPNVPTGMDLEGEDLRQTPVLYVIPCEPDRTKAFAVDMLGLSSKKEMWGQVQLLSDILSDRESPNSEICSHSPSHHHHPLPSLFQLLVPLPHGNKRLTRIWMTFPHLSFPTLPPLKSLWWRSPEDAKAEDFA